MDGEMWRWAVTPWRGAMVTGLRAGSLGAALLRGVLTWWRAGGGDAGGEVVAAALVIEHDEGADVLTVSRAGVSVRVRAETGPTPPPAAATRPAARWGRSEGHDMHRDALAPWELPRFCRCVGTECSCRAARWAGRDVHQVGRPPLAFMHPGNCAGAGCWCHAAGCGPDGVN